MANLMPLVHQARRTIRNRQEGNRTPRKTTSG
jgi:hypothetical protein